MLDPPGTRLGRRAGYTTTEADVVGHTEPVVDKPEGQAEAGEQPVGGAPDLSAGLVAAADAAIADGSGDSVGTALEAQDVSGACQEMATQSPR